MSRADHASPLPAEGTDPLQLLQQDLAAGRPLHGMSAASKELLAGAGVFTTSEPRPFNTFGEFHRYNKLQDALGTSALHAANIIQQVHEPESGQEMGHEVSRILRTITGVHADGLHAAENGVVAATRVVLRVPRLADAEALSKIFGGLLRAPENYFAVTPKTVEENGKTSYEVDIEGGSEGFTEYLPRTLERTVVAMKAQADKRRHGFVLPRDKNSFNEWKRAGETFRPEMAADLADAEQKYQTIDISADYPTNSPNMQPDRQPHLTGGSEPVFQALRDIFRPMITHTRGTAVGNLPQHPLESQRLTFEQGLHLRRDTASPEQLRVGPPQARTLRSHERAAQHVRSHLTEVRRDPVHATLRMGAEVTGKVFGGVVDWSFSGARHAYTATRASARYVRERKEWQAYKRAVRDSDRKVQRVASSLVMPPERRLF